MHMFTRRTAVPLACTLGAMACGILSIIASIEGDMLPASQLILLALVLDGLDGKLARTFKATSAFGAEMDTYVDFLCFGVAPAVLARQIALKNMGVAGVALPLLLIMSGAMRLSRFRVMDAHRGARGFTGLPITVAGSWVALWGYLEAGGALGAFGLSLTRGPVSALVWACLAVFGLLQISRIHYAKTSAHTLIFSAGVLLIAALFLDLGAGSAAALALVGYGFYYALVSPIVPALKGLAWLDVDASDETLEPESEEQTP
ncbi:MAG: CDP-alcohol phosphatidyltransferase family protein [Kiritimatiellae bacterium]|nr:CDP-alcohol phosphatidyltransferase family protein [Kiritimatiellia bacterium]